MRGNNQIFSFLIIRFFIHLFNSFIKVNLSRISSTNSIRRPIIKPRNTLKSKNPSETLSQTKIESQAENNNAFSNNNNNNYTTPNSATNNYSENLQLKIPKENSEKPPIYPGTMNVNNILSTGGYALLSQKRKEYLQRTKQNGAIITSPKTTPAMSPTSLIMPMSINTNNAANNNTTSYFSDQSQTQLQQQSQLNHNLTNLNRAQLNSPLQFYSSSNTASNKVPQKANTTTTITTPINSPNLDTNLNSGNGYFNYNNLKYTENSFRDYQAKLTTNDTNQINSGISYSNISNSASSNTNKFKPNNTDPNAYRFNESNPTLNNTDTTQLNQYTFSRIPLSPKSTLLKTNAFYNANEKQISNLNNVNEPTTIPVKRPVSTNGFNTNTIPINNTHMNTNNNNNTSSNDDTGLYSNMNGIGVNVNNQKSNVKFSYLNGNGNYNNGNNTNNGNPLQVNGQSNHQQQPVQRVLSADSISRQFKPPNRY